MQWLRKIWDFELLDGQHLLTDSRWIVPFIWIVAIGFSFTTVMMFGVVPGIDNLTISNFTSVLQRYFPLNNQQQLWFRPYLPYIWMAIAVTAVLCRAVIIISSYYLSKKKLGEQKFNALFSTYLITFFLGTASALVFSFISLLLFLSGQDADWMSNLIHASVAGFRALIQQLTPFSLGIQNYWLAILLSILAASLPGYIAHYLSHRSRLLWLLAHRPHHCPEFLFPIAAPNNNITFIETLLAIPGIIFFSVVSAMIYSEPLIFEIAIWFTLRLWVESFNHSSIHYDFALKNPLVRNISRIFGDAGVYHLVHHSAYERDQNVNFSAAPFMFWDRLFGTYRKPYEEAPPLGLTDQPTISMSPVKIVFNGFAQIFYELKMNKDWRIRFRIIFGGVFYKPPITKDFLLVNGGKKND